VIAVRSLRNSIIGGTTLAVVAVAVLTYAPAASAGSGWWHLTSGVRPGYLKPGSARDEVQEIITTPGETLGTPATAFELYVEGKEVGLFATEPTAKELGLPAATAASIQESLEGFDGKGNVQVTGGATGSAPGAIAPLVVTGIGKDAYQPVGKLEVYNATEKGSAHMQVVSVGQPDGEIYVTAENLGSGTLDGGKSPVVITDTLPRGLRAVGVAGSQPGPSPAPNIIASLPCSLGAKPTCTLTEKLWPFTQLEMRIAVVAEPGVESGESNEASVAGGEVPSASVSRPIRVSDAPTPSGVESYELTPEEERGVPATQAGVHPFQLTTTVLLNQTADVAPLDVSNYKPNASPVGTTKDLNFKWPPGLIGNPSSLAQCTTEQFQDKTGH
jgi:hypothetical protein